MTTEPIYILSGVRTAIGDFGGGLKDFAPAALGKLVIEEAVKRAGVTPSDVGHVVMGQVTQSDPKDAYLARVARSEEHTSELQSLMRISYAVFCLKKKKKTHSRKKL